MSDYFSKKFLNHLLLIGCVLLFSFSKHEFYISTVDVKANDKSGTLEFSQKLFADDFTVCLQKLTKKKVDFFDESHRNKLFTDSLVNIYVSAHVKCRKNNKPVAIHYIGYQLEGDAIWCFYESSYCAPFILIELTNSMLFDSFENQVNMVQLEYGNKVKSFLLKPNHEAVRIL